MSRQLRICLIILCILFSFQVFPAAAGIPTDQLRGTVDRVMAILQDSNFRSESKQKERREQLRQVIFARFDFAEMAKRSLGTHWRRRTPVEQQEFVRLFTELLQDTYISTIESYSGDKVVYSRETQDRQYAEVQTLVVAQEGKTFSIGYRLHLFEQDWKVYDVVIENISVVNNYRSQFSRVISKSSYEELVRALKEKKLSLQNDQ